MANAIMAHRPENQMESIREQEPIEWDLPVENGDFIDFSKLSLGTELRNQQWENENTRFQHNRVFQQPFNRNSHDNSPVLDQNQNVSDDKMTQKCKNEVQTCHHLNSLQSQCMYSTASSNQDFIEKYHNNINGNHSPQSVLMHGQSRPLIHSPTPSLNDNFKEDYTGNEIDNKQSNQIQNVQEELIELKAIITKLASQTEDVTGLPEPIQIVLKVIQLECNVRERNTKIFKLEDATTKLVNKIEKMKVEFEDQQAGQKREILYLEEKLKNCEDCGNAKKSLNASDEFEKLQERVENLEEKNKSLNESVLESEQANKLLTLDLNRATKEAECYRGMVNCHQMSEQKQKADLERYIAVEREGMERERQDRYLLLVEQNKLKHKAEKLSESCKSYQMKNDELCRIQNELEQECDQFRKLKKMIQEHGLPNHEQLIMLQQQTEMFKDDVLTERKDRERAQAQREKMRRDLEILQSRNQSLQEQVYKYQEHIMRLNTGDRRILQNQEFLQMGHQVTRYKPPTYHSLNNNWDSLDSDFNDKSGGGKFTRQLSSPAYFNPKIRMSSDITSNLMKNSCNSSMNQDSPMMNGRQVSAVNDGRGTGGFVNRGVSRRPQSFGGSSTFDQWIQQQALQHVPVRNDIINRAPRSPLLGHNGDPWIMPPAPGVSIPQANTQLGSMNYMNNIWSQQSSPTTFVSSSSSSEPPVTVAPNWQLNASSQYDIQTEKSKAFPGEPWSNGSEELSCSTSEPSMTTPVNYTSSEPSDMNEAMRGVRGFQCGKCNTKYHDTESFRGHAEKCFN